MKKSNILLLLSILIIPNLSFAYGFWWWYWMMSWFGWYWFGWGYMAIMWIIIIWLLFFGMRFGWSCWMWHFSTRSSTKPLDVLKERYAKWEIDKVKFEEMKKDLEK